MSILISARTELLDRCVIVFLAALAIYLHTIVLFHAGPLWRYEANTANQSQMSMSELRQSLAVDTHPLFMPVLAHAWISATGNEDFHFRYLGFVIGLSTIAVALLASSRFVFITVFAMHPTVIRYVDSVRPYGLGILFLLMTFGLVKRLLERPAWIPWIGALLSAVLAVNTLYQTLPAIVLISLSACAIAIWNQDKPKALMTTAVAVVSILAATPYISTVTKSFSLYVSSAEVNLDSIWVMLQETIRSRQSFLLYLYLILFGIALFSVCGKSARKNPIAWWNTLVLAVVVPLSILLLYRLKGFLFPWHYLVSLAIFGMAADEGLSLLNSTKLRIPALLFFLVFGLWMTQWARVELKTRQTNMDLAALLAKQSTDKNDLIIVYPWYNGVSFQRYYRGAVRWVTFPEISDLRIHRYDRFKQAASNEANLRKELSRVDQVIRSGHTVWFVGNLPERDFDHQEDVGNLMFEFIDKHIIEPKDGALQAIQPISDFERVHLYKIS